MLRRDFLTTFTASLASRGRKKRPVYLSVSYPVSGLQFDIETTAQMEMISSQNFAYDPIGFNTYRFLIWVTSDVTFSGQFMRLSTRPSRIENVTASDIDGHRLDASVVVN